MQTIRTKHHVIRVDDIATVSRVHDDKEIMINSFHDIETAQDFATKADARVDAHNNGSSHPRSLLRQQFVDKLFSDYVMVEAGHRANKLQLEPGNSFSIAASTNTALYSMVVPAGHKSMQINTAEGSYRIPCNGLADAFEKHDKLLRFEQEHGRTALINMLKIFAEKC